MNDSKEEVRSRLNIEDVIGEYVQLKRAGRSFKGLSPFSGEKTPSFFVSPEKQIWHDFSSNKGGDVFAFVMEVEGMDFRAALEHLARKAGVDLSMYQSKSGQAISKKKARLHEAHKLATRYYQKALLDNKHALAYVCEKRKFTRQIISDFQIGYAPNAGRALLNALEKKGFSKQELKDAGLTSSYGSDMFRGRMMVPLMDSSGLVIGFTARIIGDIDGAPKYLNTPQTLLYDKGRHVFGLSQAKEAIRSTGFAVIVEGNLDVVSSHQADVCNVVATAGTAMTEHHIRTLKRFTTDIRLAFDGDKAGIAATERAIAIASELEVDLTIVTLPDSAKDPDELIQQDPKLWSRAINESQPAVDWVIDQYKRRVDIKTAAGKRLFTNAALTIIRQLADSVEQEHYLQKISRITNTSMESIQEKLIRFDAKPEQKPMKRVNYVKKEDDSAKYVHEDNVFAVAVGDTPSQELFSHIPSSYFHGEERQKLAEYLAKNHQTPVHTVPESLQSIDTYVKIVLLKADERYANWSEEDRYFETTRLIRTVENEHRKNKQEILINELKDAEASGDEATATSLRQEINNLIKEIARGKKR